MEDSKNSILHPAEISWLVADPLMEVFRRHSDGCFHLDSHFFRVAFALVAFFFG